MEGAQDSISVCRFATQCFELALRRALARYWGWGGANLDGITVLCQRRRAGAREGARGTRPW